MFMSVGAAQSWCTSYGAGCKAVLCLIENGVCMGCDSTNFFPEAKWDSYAKGHGLVAPTETHQGEESVDLVAPESAVAAKALQALKDARSVAMSFSA